MNIKDIKPIPHYIIKAILREDKKLNPEQRGTTRYYAYLITRCKELIKITVAMRYYRKKPYLKQVAIHAMHSKECLVKDMCFNYISGYITGWHAEGLSRYQKWYEGGWGTADDKYFDPYAPVVNIQVVTRLARYKYSAIELCGDTNIFKYLRTYERYPQLEYIMKLGLKKLAASRQILEKIGKDKQFCKWLIRNREALSAHYHYVEVILKAYNTGGDMAVLQRVKELKLKLIHDSAYTQFKRQFTGNTERLVKYLAENNVTLSLYSDYYNACNELGLDMSEDKNSFPRDFRRWHDIRTDEYATKKALEDEQKRKELYEQFGLVANKYLPLQKQNGREYVAIIAKSPSDLIREGNTLHHCVGRMGYDQKFVREETLIFFIRIKSAASTPFVTVEYSLSLHKILQCYADHNSRPDDNALHFINKIWLPYANKQLRQLTA
jgi:hypothetical protein